MKIQKEDYDSFDAYVDALEGRVDALEFRIDSAIRILQRHLSMTAPTYLWNAIYALKDKE